MRRVLVALTLVTIFSLPLAASTYVVNDLGDAGDATAGDDICDTGSGICTLRAAIEEANAHAGADTIAFTGIAGTITPATAFETIVEELDIDGTTAMGFAGDPVIVVDGGDAVATGFDFSSGANDSSILALHIVGFTTAGIHVDADNVGIQRNWIGPVMATGTANGIGIHVGESASGTTIGGNVGNLGNVISGNTTDGIQIDGDSSVVRDNRVGTEPDGMSALANGDDGIELTATADGNDIGTFNPDTANLISGNFFAGVYVNGATNTTIYGNLIGTDASGTTDIGNDVGVEVDGADNTVVGVPDGSNLISGNFFDGVGINAGSTNTTVDANTIGLDSSGILPLPNGGSGIYNGGDDTIIGSTLGGNLITGNDLFGIYIDDGTATIINNVIGLDAADDIVGNFLYGIAIEETSGPNTIGGTGADEGNVISGNFFGGVAVVTASNVSMFGNIIGLDSTGTDIRGNGGYGIELFEADAITIGSVGAGMNIISGNSASGIDHVDTTNVIISGNRIGTDITGMSALGNLEAGVEICDATLGVTVSDNLISGNDLWGVWLMSDANGNTVTNNIIGLNADQSAALPNGEAGVFMTDDVFDNVIGPGNIISGNGGCCGPGIGVAVVDTAINNKIEGNSIFDNDDLGIDLGGDFLTPGDGVTPNDDDDTDTGANGLQNYPVLDAAVTTATESWIQGTFDSTPNTLHSLHFYENTTADPSGFGEGQTYLGTMQVTTDAAGQVAFTFNGPALTTGNGVTATATGPTDGTSEFSASTEALAAPTVQFDPATYATAEGGGFVTVTVTRTGDLTATTTVDYTTADDTALAGSDYTATSGTLTFLPTEATKTFDVPITDDPNDEPMEQIDLTLSNPSAASLGTNTTATIDITDNDDPPQISIDDDSENEGDAGTATFTFNVTLSAASAFTVTVNAASANDTAIEPGDYTALPSTLITFDPGETSQQVTVDANGDTTFESDETFFVELSGETNATILDGQGTGTILNDDEQPTISIDDVTQEEGNAGTTEFTFNITLSNASDQTITVNAATSDDSAVAGTDYTALPSTLVTFDPGVTSQQITVDVNGDDTFENNDRFFVDLSGETNATVADGQGDGTIVNDDFEPQISIDDASEFEGNLGVMNLIFTISLSNPSDLPVTVNYETMDDTAVAGIDYSSANSTVTFDPGETSRQVGVSASGDTTFEADDTFFVNLSIPMNAAIADSQGIGTILNDDAQPEISIDNVTLDEGDSGNTAFTFTVSLSNTSDSTITVIASSADSTANAGSDYTALPNTLVTFEPGQNSQQVTVNVTGDTRFESDETFFVNLSEPSGASIADNQGTGTITNDDTQPEILIDNVSLNEGDSGTTAFTFTVSLSNASDQTVTVTATSSDGTAAAGSDYTALPATVLTFDPGETSQQITIDVNGDTTFEANENFFIDLTVPTNATITDNQGVGSIVNDDAQPAITIDDVTENEGDAGTTSFTFTISLSNPSQSTITVDFATQDDTAISPSDYAAVATLTLTFDPGETSRQIAIVVHGDETAEGNDRFFVNLDNATNATLDDDQGEGLIQNDDGVPSVFIDDVTQSEGDAGTTTFTFNVTLSTDSESTITVFAETADGTATAGSDYTAVASTQLTFAPGVTSQPFTVDVTGDTTLEGNETFFVNLSNITNASIGDDQGTGTITNDDTEPAITIDDVTLNEGNAGTTAFTFTVSLSNASASTVTVDAVTADNTASAGSDYTAVAPTTLTFDPGETSQSFTVNVAGDVITEPAETFFVNLSGATNASIDDNQGLGTITNDDGVPSITIDDVTLNEGNAGTTAFTFTVSLSNASASTVTVDAVTADDTASAGSDYTAVASTTLTFDPGETSQSFTVNVAGDAITEPNETFFVNLSGATNASIGDNQGLGTITNDDGVPSITIDDVTLNEGNAGTTAFTFTVSLSNASASTVTVDAVTADDTASAGSDYTAVASTTLTFDPGETSQSFTVNVAGDAITEPAETFFVNLSGATNASIGDNQGLGTITNDDGVPSITIDDVTLNEGNAGTTAFTFTVSLSNASASTVTVDAVTADDTASAGTDYTAVASTTLTFDPGETSQSFTVDVAGDAITEPNETFFVNLSGATSASIGDNQGLGTITNDDTQPAIIISDVTQAEGDAGTSAFLFNVTLSNASASTVLVDYATADLTATAGADYSPTSDTLTFAPGTTLQTVSVDVTGDVLVESDEVFHVNLTNAQNATLADDLGAGTIDEDDVLGSANLVMQKTAATTTFIPGQELTFTLTVRNDGPDAATNITVVDPLPANTTYVSATSATATCDGTDVVICTIPALANGATATITLVVQTSDANDITNTATANAAQDDANAANNVATVTIAAAAPATAAIPTASEWGLLLLAAGLAMIGVMRQWSGGL